MYIFADSQLVNVYSDEIPAITSTNAAPAGWLTACTDPATGCFGYHTTDGVLEGGSTRFGPLDSYAAMSTSPEEIMYSSIPVNDIQNLVYRLEVQLEQPLGDYQASITYLSVPVF